MSSGFIGASYMAAAVIGTNVYFAGGQAGGVNDAVRNFYRYDTTANAVTGLAQMPAARTQGAMVAVGAKLYYLGGLDSGGGGTNTVYVFDTAAGTWTTAASGPDSNVFAGAATVIGATAYVVNSGGILYRSDLSLANPVWSQGVTPTSHGSYPGLVSINGALYYVSGSATANVDKLDLGAGTGYTSAVLGVKSLLNPLLAGVASALPVTPPTDTTGKAQYAQTVQTLRALAAIS